MKFSTLHATVISCLAFTGTNAQSYTKCNPTMENCPADKALAASILENFQSESPFFDAYSHADRISYGEDGVTMTLKERYDNPGLKSNFYIMFGRLEVVLKAAPGRGVVSSFYLQSDDLDEIDLEWIGSDTTEVQTNYFSKGNTTTYTRGQFHGVYEPQLEFHNYTIDWTENALTFYLDGEVLRVIESDDPSGYPQSPMYVVTGIWAGGDPGNAAGTIEWAGGEIDYNAAPYSMYVKNIIISDYSTGTEYVYGDRSGDWTSIQAVDGEVNGRQEEALEQFSILSQGGDVFTEFSWDATTTVSTGVTSSFARHSSTHIGYSSTKSSSSLATRSVKDGLMSDSVVTATTTHQKDSSNNTGSLDQTTSADVKETNGAIAISAPAFGDQNTILSFFSRAFLISMGLMLVI